ncbi:MULTISPECIES: organic hydroperoxide resistance protein [Streptomyces]|uniref:Organic hydroperoxide resistance protein n=1 Tax=Streptomyces doebereineriae TaxID=3075528 RepID=A0ABU2VR52_9ACTN|nr:organic hydroperoxide resistance protein [Streptomyces sp. DSM 41640]MDT0487576.1 organic hydroperoxide resistance protein [Streptomyces sp. DSM 41640]
MGVIYTAEVTSSGDGRKGRVRSSDGLLDAQLTSPKEVGGAGDATNPEQLFAAGWAACFHSALRMSARESKVVLNGDEVTAHVALNKGDSGFHLSAVIVVELPGLGVEVAHRLAADAHSRCPYSKAVSGNIGVEVTVKV